jgi:hypothetical protein
MTIVEGTPKYQNRNPNASVGTPKDVVGRLVDDSLPPDYTSQGPIQQALTAIKNLLIPINKELVTWVRENTPVKVTKVFVVPASGVLGGGLQNPDLSQIIFTCPESSEAWIPRLSITSPQHAPGTPLTTGSIMLIGSTFNEVVYFTPEPPAVATIPNQWFEGGNSAPHLDRGESLTISGTGLTAGDVIRIDAQIQLVQGLSEFTPRTMSPTDLTAKTTGSSDVLTSA